MGYRPEDIADLLATTLADLPDQELEYALDHQEYFWTSLFQTKTMKIDGGTSIQRKVSFDTSGNARYREMFDTDEPKFGDSIHTIQVHWALLGTNASWDEFEILQQKNSEKGYVNLVQTRKDKSIIDLADLIEETMISVPNSATDLKHPFTLPYYLRLLNSAGTINTTAGFNGTTVTFGDSSTSTIIAGIDAASETKWRNWCAPYTSINNSFLKTYRQACIKTKFRPPVILKTPLMKERAAKMNCIAGTDTVLDIMELVDKKDDNHTATGREALGGLLVQDGSLVYLNRVPVVPLDTLDSASYTPIYTFDMSYFIPVVHDGYWMKMTPPMVDRRQHTTYTSFIDGAHNILVENIRKAGFVIHKTS
jgi:hypothetical protein